ncbi:MAG: hypothetical protein M5U25_15650 [Planctomycetota bacterium]|nr:hypothetical protein [Planctomycetota bacterium]
MADYRTRHDSDKRLRALRDEYGRREPNKYARLMRRSSAILAMIYVALLGVLACLGLIYGEEAVEQAVGGPEMLYGFYGRLSVLLIGLAFGAFMAAGWVEEKD